MKLEKVFEGINRYFEKGDEEGLHRAMRSIGDELTNNDIDKLNSFRAEFARDGSLTARLVPLQVILELLSGFTSATKKNRELFSICKRVERDLGLVHVLNAIHIDTHHSIPDEPNYNLTLYERDDSDAKVQILLGLGLVEKFGDDYYEITLRGETVKRNLEFWERQKQERF